jgi:hypothetical protein
VKVDWPILVNLRLDPYERTGLPKTDAGSLAYYNWFAFEFWRFVFAQQKIAEAAQSFVEFPPMQKGAGASEGTDSGGDSSTHRAVRLSLQSRAVHAMDSAAFAVETSSFPSLHYMSSGSLADRLPSPCHVRFTPNNGH